MKIAGSGAGVGSESRGTDQRYGSATLMTGDGVCGAAG
jgi:hypothetical protein